MPRSRACWTDLSSEAKQSENDRHQALCLARQRVRFLSGAASAPWFLGVSPFAKNRGLTPNGTYFRTDQVAVRRKPPGFVEFARASTGRLAPYRY